MKHTLTSLQREISDIEDRYPNITNKEESRCRYLSRKFKAMLRGDAPKPSGGTPRPGFGGKQPGAGRKPSPIGDKPIQVNVLLDPDLCWKLDTLRGTVPRAEWFRHLLAEARPPRPPVVVSHHEVLCAACYLADEPFATYRCTNDTCPNAIEPEGQS